MDHIISVVTPSLNQAEYIDETIVSVLSQEGNFYIDYVIIDGQSGDGSVDRIAWYEKELKEKCRVKHYKGLDFYVSDKPTHINRCKGISYRWISERDQGHGDALNKGFSITKGDIMCWLNSDDVFLNDAFAIITDIYSQFNHVKWTTALNVIIRKDGSRSPITHLGRYNYKNVYSFLTNDYEYIQQEATFWHRDLWEKAGAGINMQYKLMVDGELWCRFFLHETIYHINREIGAYRLHDSNRAYKFESEVKAEMRKAVLTLEKKVPSHIRNIARDITDNAPGIVAANSDLNFLILDKEEDESQWAIRELDFFAYSIKRHAYKCRTLSQNLDHLHNQSVIETTKLKNKLHEKDAEIAKINKKIDNKREQITNKAALVENLQRKLDEKDLLIREQAESTKQFVQQLTATNHQSEKMRKMIGELNQAVLSAEKEIQSRDRAIGTLNNNLQEKDSVIASINERLDKKREQITNNAALVDNLQRKLDEKDLLIREQAKSARQFVQQLAATNHQLEQLNKNVVELNQAVFSAEKEIQSRDREIKKLRNNLQAKNRELDKSNQSQVDLQHLIGQLKDQNQNHSAIIEEYKELIGKVEKSYSLRLGKALLYPAKQIKRLLNG